MMQKNNEARFWKDIFQAKSADKKQQDTKLAETIRRYVKDGSIAPDLSDEAFDSTVKEIKRSIRTKKAITTVVISLVTLILFVVLVGFLLIKGKVIVDPFATPTLTPTITPTFTATPTVTMTPVPTVTLTPTPEPKSAYEAPLDPSEPLVPVAYDLSWVIPGDQVDCPPETSSCTTKEDPNHAPLKSGYYALFYKNDTEVDKQLNLTFTVTDQNAGLIAPSIGSGTAYLAGLDTNVNSSKFSNVKSWIFVGVYEFTEPTTFKIDFTAAGGKNPPPTLAANTILWVSLKSDQIELLKNLIGKSTVYTIQDDSLFTTESTVTVKEDPLCWLGKCSSTQKAYYSGVGAIGAGKYHLVIYDPLLDLTTAPMEIDYYLGNYAVPAGKLEIKPIEGLPGWYDSISFPVYDIGKIWFKVTASDPKVDTVTDVIFVVADAK
jgi:hypothetical protein